MQMEAKKPKINLFQYTDYRTFLSDYAKISKSAPGSRFSLGQWARRLGLGSTASLTRILAGDRMPGKAMTQKLVAYFCFTPSEAQYFEHLVLLDKSKSPAVSVLLMEKLKTLHPKRQFRPLDHETFLAISNWYYFALREMVLQEDFEEDPVCLIRQLNFKITAREVSQAIQLMLRLGLLKRDANGKLEQATPHIEWSNDIASEASKRNHEQNLENAKIALRSFSPAEREITSLCLTMSSTDLGRAKQMIRDFKQKFMEEFERPKGGDQTFQFQVQLFPMTKANKKNPKEC